MIDVYIMCAGNGKRFGGCKPIQLVEGKPNYVRTIDILKELGIENVTISVCENYWDLFEYENKIKGSSDREIDRFRNFRSILTKPSLILYGDVVYDKEDLKNVLEHCKSATKIIFFGLRTNNKLTKKAHEEIKGVFIWDVDSFYNAVDIAADKFEKGYVAREIGWEVFKELKNIDFISLSEYTDDFDTPQEYEFLLKVYNNKTDK